MIIKYGYTDTDIDKILLLLNLMYELAPSAVLSHIL